MNCILFTLDAMNTEYMHPDFHIDTQNKEVIPFYYCFPLHDLTMRTQFEKRLEMCFLNGRFYPVEFLESAKKGQGLYRN